MTLPTAKVRAEGSPSAIPSWTWFAALIGRLLAFLMKLLALSWRADRSQLSKIDNQIKAGVPVIAVFWHGSYLPLFSLAKGRPITVFTSQSFRGRVIASISRAFGYSASLVPPGRPGFLRMQAFLAAQRKGSTNPTVVAIAVDGPLGPRHAVKPGAFHIAARMGAVVIPIGVTSYPNWTITSRWDHFKIPLPFARVHVHVGSPLCVPETFGADHDEVMRLREQVHDQLTTSATNVE